MTLSKSEFHGVTLFTSFEIIFQEYHQSNCKTSFRELCSFLLSWITNLFSFQTYGQFNATLCVCILCFSALRLNIKTISQANYKVSCSVFL